MITYSPTDPTSEIYFAHGGVQYEKRRLPLPGSTFILGEWVGLGANNEAVILATGITVLMPGMVYTPSDQHDVTESEGVTISRGNFWLSTLNYRLVQSFARGDSVSVEADINSNGIGGLVKLPTATGTYWKVGVVREAPAVDGTYPVQVYLPVY